MKKCKFCNSNFKSIRSNHVFCSHNCANNHSLGRNSSNINGAIKRCITCNNKFKSKGPAHKYCKNECNINKKIATSLRNRLNCAVSNNQKAGSAVDDLGCSIEELKKHLESQFQEGMNWSNWTIDGWHIDHIKPLNKFDLTNSKQFKEACHYTNLQPLWAKDNIRKSDKLLDDIINIG